MSSISLEKWPAAVLLLSYVVFRLGLDPFWRGFSPYYSYLFEFTFLGITAFIYSNDISRALTKKWSIKRNLFELILALIAGIVVFELAVFLEVSIPFELALPSAGLETVFLLLLLAPILEELLFRVALWQSMLKLTDHRTLTLGVTTVLFALTHFMALPYVPEDVRSFVGYQTVYVLLLGLAVGRKRMQSGAATLPIAIHFAFNLGFFLAAQDFQS